MNFGKDLSISDLKEAIICQDAMRIVLAEDLGNDWVVSLWFSKSDDIRIMMNSFVLSYELQISNLLLTISLNPIENPETSQIYTMGSEINFIGISLTHPHGQDLSTKDIVDHISSNLGFLGYKVTRSDIIKRDMTGINKNKKFISDDIEFILEAHSEIDSIKAFQIKYFADWIVKYFSAIQTVSIKEINKSKPYINKF